jgi:hypothetical protein
VSSEFSRHGFSSRYGKNRADAVHHLLDPIVVAGPWVLVGSVVLSGVRAALRHRTGDGDPAPPTATDGAR